MTEHRELHLSAHLSHPCLPVVIARGQCVQALCLDSFPSAQVRAVVRKSSDVLMLNRPSKHYRNWLQLSGATHAKTC